MEQVVGWNKISIDKNKQKTDERIYLFIFIY